MLATKVLSFPEAFILYSTLTISVRTPLNSIINYLEVALEEPLDERARHHLQRSLQASKSLVFVFNDLLSLTEVEEIDFKVHEENVHLKRVVSDISEAFKEECMRRDMEVELHDDEAVPETVRCDPAGLRQVLSNLLTNSIEHGSGKLIQVGLRHVSNAENHTLIEIFFQDEGKGLSEQELDSIFQDLEQVLDEDESQPLSAQKEPEHPRPTSIGLGLAFTARFVRLNSGQISMSSVTGRGTRVSIKIPFRKAVEVDPKKAPIELSLPTPPSDVSNNPISVAFRRRSQNPAHPGPIDITTPLSTASTDRTPGSETSSNVTFPDLSSPASSRYPFPEVGVRRQKFHVLIAEDNPLNSRLLETRLTKRRHTVKVTVDGQVCADTFKRSPDAFDVILMDLQVCSADVSHELLLMY